MLPFAVVISFEGVVKAVTIRNDPKINKDRIAKVQYLLKNLTVITTSQAAIDAGIITKKAAARKLPK